MPNPRRVYQGTNESHHRFLFLVGVALAVAPRTGSAQLPAPSADAQRDTSISLDRGVIETELIHWQALTGRAQQAAHAHWEIARLLISLQDAGAPRLPSAGSFDGESYADAIMRHLVASMRSARTPDTVPSFTLGALLARGERAPTSFESSALKLLLKNPATHATALIVRAREERQRGRLTNARATIMEARRAGVDAGLVSLEDARALTALGRNDAASAQYWAAVAANTPAVKPFLMQDLTWLIAVDSVDRFAQLDGPDARAWLQRFWSQRDADVAARPGDRLTEHLRRWDYVHREYRVHQPERRTQFARVEFGFEGFDQCTPNASSTFAALAAASRRLVLPGDIRQGEPLLDHRALIYMRHGPPALTINGQGLGLPYLGRPFVGGADQNFSRKGVEERIDEMDESMFRNASWLYHIGGRWTFVHFRGSKALGMSAPTTLSTYLPVVNAGGAPYAEDWRLRAQVLQEYGKAASIISQPPVSLKFITCEGAVKRVITASREAATTALETDSDLPITLALILHFGLGQTSTTGSLGLVTYAIPSTVLDSMKGGGGARSTTMIVRTVARNLATGEIREREVQRDVAYTLQGRRDEFLTGHIEIPLSAGTWRLATRVTGADGTIMAFGSDTEVNIPAQGQLALSDILIGRGRVPSAGIAMGRLCHSMRSTPGREPIHWSSSWNCMRSSRGPTTHSNCVWHRQAGPHRKAFRSHHDRHPVRCRNGSSVRST